MSTGDCHRLEPIFEAVFDDANFGYRRGRSTKDALKKIWCELEQGNEWGVDADLKDFFGSVDHEKLLTLINQRVSDSRVFGLIRQILKAGCVDEDEISKTANRAEIIHISDQELPHSYLVRKTNQYNGQANPYFDIVAQKLVGFLKSHL